MIQTRLAPKYAGTARRLSRDHAATTVVSTVLLIALTVSVVAVAATHVGSWGTAQEPAPPLDVGASASPGESSLMLLHEGGATMDAGDLTAIVTINETVVYDGPVGPAGQTWGPGDPLYLALPSDIPPGGRASLALVDEANGRTLATATFTAPGGGSEPATASGFSLGASLSPLQNVSSGISSIWIEATVHHPEGRKYIRYVYADLTQLGGPAWIELLDDGAGGDLLAGDGVFGGFGLLDSANPGLAPMAIYAIDLDGNRVRLDIDVDVPAPPPPPVAPPGPLGTPAPPPPPPPPPPPCFRIRADGGVEPLKATHVTIETIGVDITYGADGPRIPVRAWWTKNAGGNLQSLYGGVPVARGMTAQFPVDVGDVLGVRGVASYASFHSTRNSWTSSPYVDVLKDGDLPPDVPAFGTIQQDVALYLAPYVADGKMNLDYDEAIVLVEFVSNLNSPAADFQDLVVMFRFDCTSSP